MAVIETKLQHLTDAVHKHNNFAEKIPVLEEKIKVANNRIDDLESEWEKVVHIDDADLDHFRRLALDSFQISYNHKKNQDFIF